MDAAIKSLCNAGVTFVEIELPEAIEREWLFPDIVPVELLSQLTVEGFLSASDKMDTITRERAQAGLDCKAISYVLAQRRRAELERIAAEKMYGLNGWVTPTCPGLPCPVASLKDEKQHDRALQSSRNTQPFNLFGQCATTLPISDSSSPLPAGLQLVCSANEDSALLALSLAIETHLQKAGLLFNHSSTA